VLKLPPWLAWVLIGVAAASATVSQLPVLVQGFTLNPKLAAGALLLSIALGSMGIVSAGGRKAVALIVVLGATLAAPGAFAQTLHVGPSVPLVAVTPGDPHPVALAPGAGVTVGLDLFPSTLLGRPVSILTLGADVFGAALSNGATVAANVSIALHAALYELFTVGVGLKLYDSAGYGAIGGVLSGKSVFLLLGLDYGLISTLSIGHSGATQ
jgi:hypothetical protein